MMDLFEIMVDLLRSQLRVIVCFPLLHSSQTLGMEDISVEISEAKEFIPLLLVGAMVEQEDENGTTLPHLCRSPHRCRHCHGGRAHIAGQR